MTILKVYSMMTEHVEDILLRELENDKNPFVREREWGSRNKIYMRFDKIEIANSLHGLVIAYFWKGITTHVMQIEGTALNDSTATISLCVEGRMEITIDKA